MQSYLVQLQKELSEYMAQGGREEGGSILEFLFYCYLSSVPGDDGRIGKCEEALAPVFGELSLENSDRLFDRIADLCAAYQRSAFLEGIQIGFQLSAELNA